MVTYARNSAGAYELDVPQIRQAFILTESIRQQIWNFRTDRIAAIVSNNTPVNLCEGAKISLHLLPLSSFSSNLTFDVVEYENLYLKLKPHGIGGIQHRHNFDGIVIFGGIPDNGYRAYVQFFRTGVIEFVWVYEIRDENRFIKSYDYEFKTLQNFISAIEVFRELDIHPPVFVFLTLSGLTGYSLYINDKLRWNYDLDDNYTFDRDILAIHDIQLDSFDENNNNIFRPLFDIVWNAAGLRESLNFNENNEFIRRP